ncbi:MAG: VOC family protein [Hyphomicrobiaceae bacterium]|nr:VOC family protein [Hyphomicrobiaceae bacterium]
MFHAKLVPELLCSDLQASLDFYTGLGGFEILYERPEEGFAFIDLNGAQLMLEEAPEVTGDDRVWWTAEPRKPYGRGINLQIEVEDADVLHQRLLDAQWPLFRPMEEKWYRVKDCMFGNRQFLVQDSDGYLLRFFHDLGKRSV